MLKKIALVLTLVVSIGVLSACGPKSIEEVEGQEYECSQFTALCPSGWINSPVKELNNDAVLSLNHLRFYKVEAEEGQELGSKLYSNAYVDIAHYPVDSKIYESRDIYQNVEVVEIEING